MSEKIYEIFGADFPWSHTHLRKAADHLGFWADASGDKINTGIEPITGTTLYFAKGRDAVTQFAKQTPDDFVEVVGSQKTQETWRKLADDAAAAEVDALVQRD